MEAKLLKIPLKSGVREKVDALLGYMKSNNAFPKSEMEQKGYYWDSVFYSDEQGVEYLFIVLKSNDFSRIMVDESSLIETPFRQVYEDFRRECWAPEPYQDLEALCCFNSDMNFTY